MKNNDNRVNAKFRLLPFSLFFFMRILVAGIGNIFLGDDAFGSEVARELARSAELPDGVRVVDFGIRSYDLAYAIMDGPDATILVDATPRGEPPGTVSLVEPDLSALAKLDTGEIDAHSMNPVRVLQLVRSLGGEPSRGLYLVGCEPAVLEADALGLSEPVQAAVPQAVAMIQSLVRDLLQGKPILEKTGPAASGPRKEVN